LASPDLAHLIAWVEHAAANRQERAVQQQHLNMQLKLSNMPQAVSLCPWRNRQQSKAVAVCTRGRRAVRVMVTANQKNTTSRQPTRKLSQKKSEHAGGMRKNTKTSPAAQPSDRLSRKERLGSDESCALEAAVKVPLSQQLSFERLVSGRRNDMISCTHGQMTS